LQIPWYEQTKTKKSIVKNRWIEIRFKDTTCFGQWEDVGPLKSDDFDYVFDDGLPQNTFGVRAGIDLSPAIWDCLGMQTNDEVEWRFGEDGEVPQGPWRDIITTSDVVR
jgi:hypothetical protein